MTAGASGAAVRAEAARAVDAVAAAGRSLDDALADAEARVAEADRPLLRQLAYGTLRSHWRLRAWARSLMARPLKRRDSVVDALIAVGLWQLAEGRVPDHAAVSLTVEAARRLGRPRHAALVNAVLRNFRRRRVAASEPAEEEARHNHPAWLLRRLRADWPGHWREIVAANDERAPMWLRVNRLRTTTEAYLGRLGEAGAPAPAGATLAGFPDAIRLETPRPVQALPGFEEGDCSVQDAAAQLAAPWLLAGGGERILDACAAPGGKTAHLLELTGGEGRLTAVELRPERLAQVRLNLARLGLDATLVAGDASKPEDWWDGEPFDCILLDAPCSATGVIRRHPDIKLLRREGDVARLAERQRNLLQALWRLLVPGGRLLYVTCSVLAAENERVVGPFLEANPDAREDELLPNYNIRALMYRRASGFQTLPGRSGLDGFYYACLVKQGR